MPSLDVKEDQRGADEEVGDLEEEGVTFKDFKRLKNVVGDRMETSSDPCSL